MAYIDGTYRVLYIQVNGLYLPIACLTGNAFSEAAISIPTTTRDNKNGWTSVRPTAQSYTIAFSALETDEQLVPNKITYDNLRTLKRSRQLFNWKIDDGFKFDYGQGFLTRITYEAGQDVYIAFEGTIEGQGAPGSDFDNAYFGYIDRVEADGGEITNYACLERLIYKWQDF